MQENVLVSKKHSFSQQICITGLEMCLGRSGCKLQWPLQSPQGDSFTAPRPYQSPPEGVLSLGFWVVSWQPVRAGNLSLSRAIGDLQWGPQAFQGNLWLRVDSSRV